MPTVTARRPITPRQQAFIASLAGERVLSDAQLRAAAAAATGSMTSHDASVLIDALQALPRAAARNHGTAEELPTPSTESRAGRMLRAGGIEATVTLQDGRHVTINIRTRKRTGRRGWTNAAVGDEGSRTTIRILSATVGWVNLVNGEWKLTLRTRRDEYRQAILALFEYAGSGVTAGGERVQEASRCGRCMRTLTDPVSIDRGIGPECFGRDTGSQHVAAERAAAGDTVTALVDGTYEAAPEGGLRRVVHPTYWDAEMARSEREAENRAFASDPDYRAFITATDEAHGVVPGLTAIADALLTAAPQQVTPVAIAVSAEDLRRARDLIAEALDAYCAQDDSAFAIRIFDQLAAR